MTDDERQRTIDFILQQQAQFTADMQVVKENQNVLTDSLLRVVGMVGRLTEGQERMIEAQERTWAAMEAMDARLSERMDKLAESQAHTDERLNALIIIVKRYFSNGRDGKSEA
jgi:hypothetical protein